MSNFITALPYVIQNEGIGYEGYPETDQPTNTGIIAADVAKYRNVNIDTITVEIMKSLSKEEINDIYLHQYWNPMRLSEVNDPGTATAIFDCGVNRGLSVGVKYAQRACNLYGGALVVDGVMGMRSLAAVNKISRATFINQYVALVLAGYEAIISEHPIDERYKNGWFARANRMLTLI